MNCNNRNTAVKIRMGYAKKFPSVLTNGTLRNCLEGERNVTIEEVQELIDEGADFSIPAENEVCVIITPIP